MDKAMALAVNKSLHYHSHRSVKRATEDGICQVVTVPLQPPWMERCILTWVQGRHFLISVTFSFFTAMVNFAH
jgi:hypothetical protein